MKKNYIEILKPALLKCFIHILHINILIERKNLGIIFIKRRKFKDKKELVVRNKEKEKVRDILIHIFIQL